jgi:hypothetical protein
MHSTYLFLALDIARERSAEADRDRLAAQARPGSRLVAGTRRLIARSAIAIARAADEGYERAATLPS